MKVLLVDDHPLFGLGFAHALTHQACDIEVQTALTLDAGLALARREPDFDLVLLDYRLSQGDGIEGLRRFGESFPLMARVLISGDEDAALVARARAAGASGFLGKSLPIDAVLAALQLIAGGGVAFAPAAATPSLRSGTPRAPAPTARQLEVLHLLAQGQPNKRIASELGIAERTVKLHITALLELMAARNRTHLLLRAQECGLI